MSAAGAGQVRLLIVDDNDAVRSSLRALLAREPGIAVVAEAASAAQAVAAAERSCPDVVLMDLHLPDGTGVEAARAIRARRPAVRVVLFTARPEREALFAAALAGACAYVVKGGAGAGASADELVVALHAAGHGRAALAPGAAAAALDPAELERRAGQRPAEHDVRVLALISMDATDPEIAAELGVPEAAVRAAVGRLMRARGLLLG